MRTAPFISTHRQMITTIAINIGGQIMVSCSMKGGSVSSVGIIAVAVDISTESDLNDVRDKLGVGSIFMVKERLEITVAS